MKIGIIGAGVVGTAVGQNLSEHGHEAIYFDTRAETVDALRAAGFQSFRPRDYGNSETSVTMICVPTPTVRTKTQLMAIRNAAKVVGAALKRRGAYHLVVIRSTVPPGTAREVVLPLLEAGSGKRAGVDFGLAVQPEYLRAATALPDERDPRLVLIGELDRHSGDVLESVYVKGSAPMVRCHLEEAEYQKYVHNSFNALKIAAFNEMRSISVQMGWDTEKIFEATVQSAEGLWNPRYGTRDLGPFAGACLPKDTEALLGWVSGHRLAMPILRAAVRCNQVRQAEATASR